MAKYKLMGNILIFLLISIFSKVISYGYIDELYENIDESIINLDGSVTLKWLPTFVSEPLEMWVDEGSTAHLPCFVDMPDGFVLLWKKDGAIIAVGDNLHDLSDPRVSLNTSSNGSKLVIKNVAPFDQACYSCSVSVAKKTELVHNLNVRVQPVLVITPSKPIKVREGSSVRINCQVIKGFPHPQLSWVWEGKIVTQNREEGSHLALEIQNIHRNQTGEYVCVGNNGFGNKQARIILKIDVQFSPILDMSARTLSSTKTEVVCDISSNPSSSVKWYLNDEEIDISDCSDHSKHVLSDNKYRQSLIFVKDINNYGEYKCKAVNSLGEAEKSVTVYGEAGPVSVSFIPLPDDPRSYQVMLLVQSETPVISFVVQYKPRDNENWTEVIVPPLHTNNSVIRNVTQDHNQSCSGQFYMKDLLVDMEYQVRVATENSSGLSQLGELLSFTTQNKTERNERQQRKIAIKSTASKLYVIKFALILSLLTM